MHPMTIRIAERADLAPLHALACESLGYEQFSAELLAEKLFRNPRPERYAWDTLVAEAGGSAVGFLHAVNDAQARRAWVGMFAVSPTHRRQGIARRLFEHAFEDLTAPPTALEALAIPGNYFTPGLDPRYTAALCLLERLGFERFKDCVNMTVALDRAFETAPAEEALAVQGVTVRRARGDDAQLLDEYFSANFGDDWRYEAGLAFEANPVGLHLGLRDGQVIAFSAHSTQNREWGFFGPMGTSPKARGLGIGRVLLWHCLNDLRDAGHQTAIIPWVGPISFYHRWSGARVERVFWRLRRTTQ